MPVRRKGLRIKPHGGPRIKATQTGQLGKFSESIDYCGNATTLKR